MPTIVFPFALGGAVSSCSIIHRSARLIRPPARAARAGQAVKSIDLTWRLRNAASNSSMGMTPPVPRTS
jgi:hypothetical protein